MLQVQKSLWSVAETENHRPPQELSSGSGDTKHWPREEEQLFWNTLGTLTFKRKRNVDRYGEAVVRDRVGKLSVSRFPWRPWKTLP